MIFLLWFAVLHVSQSAPVMRQPGRLLPVQRAPLSSPLQHAVPQWKSRRQACSTRWAPSLTPGNADAISAALAILVSCVVMAGAVAFGGTGAAAWVRQETRACTGALGLDFHIEYAWAREDAISAPFTASCALLAGRCLAPVSPAHAARRAGKERISTKGVRTKQHSADACTTSVAGGTVGFLLALPAACRAAEGAEQGGLQMQGVLPYGYIACGCALAVAFVAGWSCARAVARSTKRKQSDWLDDLTLSTRGAAVVYSLTSVGVMDALPLPGEPSLPAPVLARLCGIRGGGAGSELRRLLCFLAGFGIVEARHLPSAGTVFRHTPHSLELREGGRARSFALVHLSPAQVRPWWRIRDALAGRAESHGGVEDMPEPFRLEHEGRGAFEFYADPANAELARHFNDLMRELSASPAAAANCAELVAALPLWDELAAAGAGPGGVAPPLVVDVGGGLGHVLAAVLGRHRGLRGILLDRPDVVLGEAVVPELRGALAPRASLVAGDFLGGSAGIPGHADAFVLKWVLHDWSDARCRSILRNIRAAVVAAPGAEARGVQRRCQRLVIVEEAVPEEDDQSEAAQAARRRHNDSEMWVVYGGRERTVAEYTQLLEEEGFATYRVTHLDGFNMVAIEAEIAPTLLQLRRNFSELEAVARKDAVELCEA
mmetsp:Transcript_113013/g.314510  ORF Transcript_113013/g.314510 Transcript_113013/m.314510 type:complete len:660 (-) Transcript_113013:406-2385(-)|eukprot:CAMPEP_0179099156 /NCGR_PEP_ID=MMETSP0796-20121207/45732_1 /TAXON_ID=73915 /ORGANISM="Pyrodinium bahamense, Strain pbaha01" /LENGTH=659 /DNA_ID=CAMNT_0020796953 /DNA_START=21 /DNA_END=2000 /DNA_ORIENTATION=+